MVRKHSRYLLAYVAWSIVTMGGFFLLVTGTAEGYVSVPDVPDSPVGPPELSLFAVMVVVFLAGTAAIRLLQKLSWLRVGRTLGLSRDGGLFPSPPLTGEVRNRDVRARTIDREEQTEGAGNESNTNAYTVVDVELHDPVESGLVIRRADEAGLVGNTLGDDPPEGRDRIEAYDADEELSVDDVLSGAAQDALLDPAHFDDLTVGAAPQWLLDENGPITRSFFGALGAGTLAEQVDGDVHEDADRVTLESRGVVLSSSELERQVQAAISVAESVETDAPDR